MKRYLQIVIPILLVLAALGAVLTQTQRSTANRIRLPLPPSYPFEEAKKLAQDGLPTYFEAIGPNFDGSGFKNAEEAQRATLGTPYISYSFDLPTLSDPNYRNEAFRNLLDGGANIEFPILVDGEPRSNISVGYREKQWLVTGFGGYWPGLIVSLQEQLAQQGITDRVDLVVLGVSWATFGMIEHQGQTLLIPLDDQFAYFPTLDTSGKRMYTLDEVLPLVHDQAKIIVAQMEEEDRRFREALTSLPPQRTPFIPTDEPMPANPTPGPLGTPSPEPVLAPGEKVSTEPVITLTPVP